MQKYLCISDEDLRTLPLEALGFAWNNLQSQIESTSVNATCLMTKYKDRGDLYLHLAKKNSAQSAS